jgi:hypothetical protein
MIAVRMSRREGYKHLRSAGRASGKSRYNLREVTVKPSRSVGEADGRAQSI